MDLKELTLAVTQTAREAGSFIKSLHGRIDQAHVEVKGLNDFVTKVDKASEKLIIDQLSKLLPGSSFLAEEETVKNTHAEYVWVIDPLDGTTNFIHGLPCYCVSIGLLKNNEPIAGVIFEVNQDECFYAWKDGGAYLNGRKIHVSNTSSVKNSLIATGFPYTEFKHLDRFMETLYFFMRNSHGLRRLGSAATDIAYVACGRFEGFYEYGLAPWDIAAGIVILKEAGGRVSDFHGGDDYLFGEEIVAANSNVFNELLESVANIMHKQSLS
jgi:myo-inositol-1(or 4)-monophosphatase